MRLAVRFCLFWFLGLLSLACLQASDFSPMPSSKSLLVSSSPSFLPLEQAYQLDPVTGSSKSELLLDWQMADGYFLYRHAFAVELSLHGKSLPVEVVYPTGQVSWDDYYQRELEKYYAQASLVVSGLPDTGWQDLHLQVSFQGCADAGLCYPPETWRYRFDHVSGVFEPQQANADELSADAVAGEFLPSFEIKTANPLDASIGLMLLFALLGGLLLNLMPCVFPVLSIKVMSFATHAQKPSELHRHGWSYTLGVVSSLLLFAFLLLALKSAGMAVGWGFQLQSPVFVSLLVYLFFALGLSFSGVWSLGDRLMQFAGSHGGGSGYGASFVTGALAVMVASPCSAPFMGVAMGYALTRGVAETILVFVFLGLGLALPFLLLCYLPALVQRIPAPGLWMVRLKQFLAWPLYASALWLLWVLDHQAGSKAVLLVAAACAVLGVLLWLWSRLAAGSRSLSRYLLASVLLLVLALPLSPLLRVAPAEPESSSADELSQAYSEEVLLDLLAKGEPVFLNMTADWCITCLANEKAALSSPAFRQALAQQGIHYLKGDWTRPNAEITRLLSHFGRSGVPLYVLFDREGKAQVLPQLLTEKLVLEHFTALER